MTEELGSGSFKVQLKFQARGLELKPVKLILIH